ncbi:abhydrolase domain containing 13-like protein Bem46 [Lycorma delicatula]|uniref:abhydrolase domain containing 13-like protein Bem46 n=1 Tax=Lycorma delicatula TaxID=130591 RepID=UPI003F519AFF
MKSALKKFSCSKFWQYFSLSFVKCWAISGMSVFIFIIVYWIYGGLLAYCTLFVIILVILYQIQDNLLYHPEDSFQSRYYVQIPPVVGLPYENIFLRSIDGTLIHLYFIAQIGEKSLTAPTLVFFHGNAGNMGHRLQNASGLYHNLHCNILMVEYRGYGLSSGRPSEEGLCMDARAAVDYLSSRKDINHRQIIVFGRSLGGAIAIDLAARPEYSAKIWCLILENTFTSIPDMADALFQWRFLKSIPLICYKNKFLSRQKIARVNNPTLFVSGLSDALVPPAMMTELHNKCGSIYKQLLHIEAGTHNDTWTCSGYYTSIANFLHSAATFKPDPPIIISSIKDV